MDFTGIVREIDEMGRIVIPKEIRNSLDVKHKDSFEVLLRDQDIILRKCSDKCIFCGSHENLSELDGKGICKSCIEKVSKL